MRYISALLLGTLLAAPAWAQSGELAYIMATLGGPPLLRAEFQQEKTLPALSRPLLSQGQLVFAREAGVLWRLSKPVPAELVVTPQAILQKTARTQSRIPLAGSPYGAAAGSLLQLLSGDGQRLQQLFVVEQARRQGEHWELRLRPREAGMARLFQELQARGDGFLRELTLLEAGGGQTRLRFSQHQTQPAVLSAQEQALFDLLD